MQVSASKTYWKYLVRISGGVSYLGGEILGHCYAQLYLIFIYKVFMNWFIAQPDISYALYLLFIALSILNKLPTKGN